MVIIIIGTCLTKQHSCARIDEVLSDCCADMHSVVRGYMKLMSDYPVEFGRQISKLPPVVTHDEIVDVFGGRTLSLARSYWDSGSEGEWTNLIKNAATIAADEFEVAFEDFELPNTGPFLLKISERIKEFIEKGIDQKIVMELKKTIFDTCDELMVRLSLVTDLSLIHI